MGIEHLGGKAVNGGSEILVGNAARLRVGNFKVQLKSVPVSDKLPEEIRRKAQGIQKLQGLLGMLLHKIDAPPFPGSRSIKIPEAVQNVSDQGFVFSVAGKQQLLILGGELGIGLRPDAPELLQDIRSLGQKVFFLLRGSVDPRIPDAAVKLLKISCSDHFILTIKIFETSLKFTKRIG